MENEKRVIELLTEIANNPQDSLKKFVAKEILSHDEPMTFIRVIKQFGLETIYHYEDLEQTELQEFYNVYSKEILKLEKESKMQHSTIEKSSWFALEKTIENINKDIDLEL